MNFQPPKVVVAATDGARFEAFHHGAHVTSWVPASGGPDRLFLSPLSSFAEGTAIRGGIPVCFPQFADQGPLPMHGFARDTAWDLVAAGRDDDGAASARFRLADSPQTRALWPHAFLCELAITASGPSLVVSVAVTNTGSSPFAFTAALHTYLHVDDVRETRIRGLAGARYRDKVLRENDVLETGAELAVDRPLDRVYRAVPADLEVREAHRALSVIASGTTDTVVWNPGPRQSGRPADLAGDAYLNFLCVEAAVASTTVTLSPGATWRASQRLTALPAASPP